MSKSTNLIKRCLIFVVAFVAVLTIKNNNQIYAAENYKQLDMNYSKVTKVGKYYLKYNPNNYKIYISNSKNGKYVVTPLSSGSLYTDSKNVVYINSSSNKLMKYNLSSRKSTTLKNLSSYCKNDETSMNISAYYNGNFYITKGSIIDWKYWTYMYNLSSKKIKLVKSNFTIMKQTDKYAIVTTEFRTDVSTVPVYIYKLTNSGVQKIKTLTKDGFDCSIIGNNVYYTDYPSVTKCSDGTSYHNMKKAVLYKTSMSGNSKKKIATFTTKEEYSEVIVTEITSKDCKVYKDGKNYLYTYKTKKFKKIN